MSGLRAVTEIRYPVGDTLEAVREAGGLKALIRERFEEAAGEGAADRMIAIEQRVAKLIAEGKGDKALSMLKGDEYRGLRRQLAEVEKALDIRIAKPGDRCDELPSESRGWMLAQGHVEEVDDDRFEGRTAEELRDDVIPAADADVLAAVAEAENDRNTPRVTVLRAIAARRAELEGDAEEGDD